MIVVRVEGLHWLMERTCVPKTLERFLGVHVKARSAWIHRGGFPRAVNAYEPTLKVVNVMAELRSRNALSAAEENPNAALHGSRSQAASGSA